jgi:hypothetical protein
MEPRATAGKTEGVSSPSITSGSGAPCFETAPSAPPQYEGFGSEQVFDTGSTNRFKPPVGARTAAATAAQVEVAANTLTMVINGPPAPKPNCQPDV